MKKTYIVIYDISDDGDSNGIHEKLKSYSGWAKITESTWAIVTLKKAKEIRDELKNYIGTKGRLFVVKSGVEAAWSNVRASNVWFKKNL
jgi:hypothetical protein